MESITSHSRKEVDRLISDQTALNNDMTERAIYGGFLSSIIYYLSGQTLVCLLPLLQHKYIGSGGTASRQHSTICTIVVWVFAVRIVCYNSPLTILHSIDFWGQIYIVYAYVFYSVWTSITLGLFSSM